VLRTSTALVVLASAGVGATPLLAMLHALASARSEREVWSCRTGVCQTCRTDLLSGTVAYTPDPLEPPAEGAVLLCCAHPTSAVTLDL
jgi:ferredoxin